MQMLQPLFHALLRSRQIRAFRSMALLLLTWLFAWGQAWAQGTTLSPDAGAPLTPAGNVVFVAGTAVLRAPTGSRVSLEKGQSLREGDHIQTQSDGYVYVRMADGGLLVVRPSSELQIDKWRYDPLQPQRSEIRYTLKSGVARYVSGQGSQSAKDRFRFNTPLAAIGVRGTDFTVLADPSVTRVVVRSGGVIVSSFGGACRVDALGPCEGDAATELFASAREKMIQFRQGDMRPELVDANVVPSPDKARPPAPSEPVALRRPAATVDVAIENYRARQIIDSYEPAMGASSESASLPLAGGAALTPSINTASGRIGDDLGASASKAALDDILNGRSLIASNRYYAVAGYRTEGIALPNAGSAEFKLVSHQGIVFDKVANQAVSSEASNAFLRIDFANRLFSTGFDLRAKDMATRIEGSGSVGTDGTLLSTPFTSPTLVQGLVGGPLASEATYIYQRTLSRQFDAAGAASWGK